MSPGVQFDPDAFMAARKGAPAFDPDAFMAQRQAANAEAPGSDIGHPQLGPSPTMAKVGNTIFQDVAQAPAHIMDFLSGHPVDEAVQGLQALTAARRDHQARAVEAFQKGDYRTAATQGFFGAVPFLGPLLGTAADEWTGGHKPEAVAHAVEILAPFLGDPAMGALESQAVSKFGAAASRGADLAATAAGGALKGAAKSTVTIKPYGRFNIPVPQPLAGGCWGLCGAPVRVTP